MNMEIIAPLVSLVVILGLMFLLVKPKGWPWKLEVGTDVKQSSVNIVQLAKDDTLVLYVKYALSEVAHERLTVTMREGFKHHKCVVIEDGASLAVVRHVEEQERKDGPGNEDDS